jgi:hypothetical protein
MAKPDLKVAQLPQGWALIDGKNALPIPPGMEKPLEWIAARGMNGFGDKDLAVIMPDEASRQKLLRELLNMRVVEAV